MNEAQWKEYHEFSCANWLTLLYSDMLWHVELLTEEFTQKLTFFSSAGVSHHSLLFCGKYAIRVNWDRDRHFAEHLVQCFWLHNSSHIGLERHYRANNNKMFVLGQTVSWTVSEVDKLVSSTCISSFSENPARTFDLALQVACPSSENEGEPSFLNLLFVLFECLCNLIQNA